MLQQEAVSLLTSMKLDHEVLTKAGSLGGVSEMLQEQPYCDIPLTKGSWGKSLSLTAISVHHQFQFPQGNRLKNKTQVQNRQRFDFLHSRKSRGYNTEEIFSCPQTRNEQWYSLGSVKQRLTNQCVRFIS